MLWITNSRVDSALSVFRTSRLVNHPITHNTFFLMTAGWVHKLILEQGKLVSGTGSCSSYMYYSSTDLTDLPTFTVSAEYAVEPPRPHSGTSGLYGNGCDPNDRSRFRPCK